MKRFFARALVVAAAASALLYAPAPAGAYPLSAGGDRAVAGGAAEPKPAPPAARRVRFEPGAICARVPGSLAPRQDSAYFVVRASQGQHMLVNLAPGPSGREFANVGVVTSPSGAQDGGKGGRVFDATLAESGDYTIRVGRNLMATRGGRAGFVLEIVVY